MSLGKTTPIKSDKFSEIFQIGLTPSTELLQFYIAIFSILFQNLRWIFLDCIPLPPSCIFSKKHGQKVHLAHEKSAMKTFELEVTLPFGNFPKIHLILGRGSLPLLKRFLFLLHLIWSTVWPNRMFSFASHKKIHFKLLKHNMHLQRTSANKNFNTTMGKKFTKSKFIKIPP